MANLDILRAALNAAIYQNYNNEISGSTLNTILNSMVDAIGSGYQFRGVATPETNPGTPDPNVFYIAAQVGTYSNFGLSVGENEVALFLWDGIWRKQNTGAASAEVVSQLGQEVNTELKTNVASVVISSLSEANTNRNYQHIFSADEVVLTHPSSLSYVYLWADIKNPSFGRIKVSATGSNRVVISKKAFSSSSFVSIYDSYTYPFVFPVPTDAEIIRVAFAGDDGETSSTFSDVRIEYLFDEIDNYPVEDSDNLVKSGGVFSDAVSLARSVTHKNVSGVTISNIVNENLRREKNQLYSADELTIQYGTLSYAYHYVDVKNPLIGATIGISGLINGLNKGIIVIAKKPFGSDSFTTIVPLTEITSEFYYVIPANTEILRIGFSGVVSGQTQSTYENIRVRYVDEQNLDEYKIPGIYVNNLKGIDFEQGSVDLYQNKIRYTSFYDRIRIKYDKMVHLPKGVTLFSPKQVRYYWIDMYGVEHDCGAWYENQKYITIQEGKYVIQVNTAYTTDAVQEFLSTFEIYEEGAINEKLVEYQNAENGRDILYLYPRRTILPVFENYKFRDTDSDGFPDTTYKTLSLLWFSDIHAFADTLKRLITLANEYKDYIDDILFTGDAVLNSWADGFSFWASNNANRVLFTLGNHDALGNGTGSVENISGIAYSAKACYERYIQPFLTYTQPSEYVENKCYWVKDYADAKVRLIAIDIYHWNETINWTNGSASTTYPDGGTVDTGEQATWFATKLAEAKTLGYSVICSAHAPFADAESIGCTFQTLSPSKGGGLLEAPIQAVQSFIENEGTFICWLAGHNHKDKFQLIEGYPDQLQIAIDTCSRERSNGSFWTEYPKIKDTKSMDCMNLFSVDTKRKYIRMFRIGAEYDRHCRHIGSIVYDYYNKELIYNG